MEFCTPQETLCFLRQFLASNSHSSRGIYYQALVAVSGSPPKLRFKTGARIHSSSGSCRHRRVSVRSRRVHRSSHEICCAHRHPRGAFGPSLTRTEKETGPVLRHPQAFSTPLTNQLKRPRRVVSPDPRLCVQPIHCHRQTSCCALRRSGFWTHLRTGQGHHIFHQPDM